MKISIIVFLLTITAVLSANAAQKIIELPEILKPGSISVDKTQFYITENETVYIYSLTDFKLINKFGKKGEGPQEFKTSSEIPLTVNVQTNNLLVNSIGKVSFFTKKGEYKNEIKTLAGVNLVFIPLQKNFVGMGIMTDNNANYYTVNIYNSTLNKIKEIYRIPHQIQPGKMEIKVAEQTLIYAVFDNKIFITGSKDFIIDVLSDDGKKLYSIQQPYEPVKFTQEMRDSVMNYFKTSPDTKNYFDMIKMRLRFPDTLPAIYSFFVSNQKIFVLTNRTFQDKKSMLQQRELLIFNTNKKLLKKLFVPLRERGIETLPYCIENEKLYQLIETENDGDEAWKLYITDIQ